MSSDSISVGSLMQLAAWGLGIGTSFFAIFGARVERDFFLTMGLIACILGDLAFAAFLSENASPDGKGNATMITLFLVLALLALYGLGSQLFKYKEGGCIDDEDDDDDEAQPGASGAAGAVVDAAVGAGAVGGAGAVAAIKDDAARKRR